MMAAAYLVAFLSEIIAGWLGRFYEPLPGHVFWLMMAAIALTGTLIVGLFGRGIDARMDALDRLPDSPVTKVVPISDLAGQVRI